MTKDENSIKELEQKIEELEQKNSELNEIICNAPIPIFAIDSNHKITHFNKALEALSGLSRNKMIGTDHQWKAFYSKRRPIMADFIIDKSSEEEIIKQYGKEHIRPTHSKERFAATNFFSDLGEEGKWLYFCASAVTNAKGEITSAVEILQDVTDEKIAQQKTRELYRIYQGLLDFIPYPIVVYDDKGLVSYLNPSFSTIFGWSIEELTGKPVPFVPQGLQAETSNMLNKFQEEKSLTRYETQRLTKSGKMLDVVIWADSYSMGKSNTRQNFVILRDITEEKRLEANNKTIMRISAVLPEYPELEELMNYISQEVKELLKTEGALVLLYDEITDELFFTGGAYDDFNTQKRAKTFRFPADSLLAGEIIKTGEYALINDTDKLKSDYPERDEKLGYQTKSILEVPIKNDDRIIGVLCAINKKQNKFNYNDMELMTMIAGTCGISIENARFAEAVKEAYLDVASMNRAKGKAINHLSHELKTPVAILIGSLQILQKKLESVPDINIDGTLDRIERNLNRIVDIQDEVADIMEDKTYSAQKMLLKMFESCQDELETLILQNLSADSLENSIRQFIDEKFGPRSIIYKNIDFSKYFNKLYSKLQPEFEFRDINIEIDIDDNLPSIQLPEEILNKMLTGLIRNAIENTPDNGKINLAVELKKSGIEFCVHDFGVGIVKDDQKRIFEGFFNTQETLLYSTKTPFAFNAGGKGADLLRTKIFSDRLGFTLKMESKRCVFLLDHSDIACPGDIEKCEFCHGQQDCLSSGGSVFTIFFPVKKIIRKSL
ncbi:MAG: PAS domain S-box protein [Deltaproteobacteria bacterium]|jgi:PAS domain S-box-containing protein|nr:PAS domain S-box protein [Deltaproteobacteria bacterium]